MTPKGALEAIWRAAPQRDTVVAMAALSTASRAAALAPPKSLRHGVLHYTVVPCALGQVLLATTPQGVAAVLLGDAAAALVADLQQRYPRAVLQPVEAAAQPWVQAVCGHLAQPHQPHGLPLDVQGTAFQQRVWQALQAIPAGQTCSYAALAAAIGQPAAVRAVASACAANPLAVVVPCHRVLRTDGGLGGYRWGLARKQQLLAWEAQASPPAVLER